MKKMWVCYTYTKYDTNLYIEEVACFPSSYVLMLLFPNLLFLQLVKLAKRLKKEKVNVDIINFGEEVRY